ncbi:DUF1272 domain-containing protein [Oceanihabitans sp. 2_MG-2023]|uniref:DUF1272 domain-containing protein n=1 Tax=Oceanihabitans sp. 2_MG-2023 TaxID=3062661 RepID=UPI0026E2B0B2|nr:DUF1272 domain-containing protein [Oceanihabitans sp. 2_MG-2023]MDO6595448.1 DUF1272 domain-containing protein [Oceanihabitans sp. 2_MG-2023]
MLEIRPTCEHCNKALPHNAEDAMICTFECTYCKACAEEVLKKYVLIVVAIFHQDQLDQKVY